MEQDAEYYFKRSEERYRSGNLKGGDADLDMAIRLAPDNPDYRWTRGILKYEVGDYRAAVEDFATIINRGADPETLRAAYMKLAIAHEVLGQYRELAADLDWLITHGFGDAGLHIWRARYRLQLGETAGAIEDFSAAHALSPRTNSILLQRAQAYYAAQRYEDAIGDLTQVIRSGDTQAGILEAAYHWRGMARYRLGGYHEALEDFNQGTRLRGGQTFTSLADYIRAYNIDV